MVRKGSTVRVRKGAPGAGPRARSARRSSSVGESTRLIIVGSRVRVPPPLPGRFPTLITIPPDRAEREREHPMAEREVRAHQAALEHRDDRSHRPREDDADRGDHEGAADQNPNVHFTAFDQIDKAPEEKAAWDHDLDRARGVRDGEPSLRARRLPGSRRLHQEHDHGCGADGRRDPGGGGDRWSDAADV